MTAQLHEDCPNSIYIKDLTEKFRRQDQQIEKIMSELSVMKESAGIEKERITQIYGMLSEIKVSLSELSREMQKIQVKPDSFKNTAASILLDLIKLATIGGLFYYLSTFR